MGLCWGCYMGEGLRRFGGFAFFFFSVEGLEA